MPAHHSDLLLEEAVLELRLLQLRILERELEPELFAPALGLRVVHNRARSLELPQLDDQRLLRDLIYKRGTVQT